MKLSIAALISLFLILALVLACSPEREVLDDKGNWEVLKSPLSGKCYEAFLSQTSHAYQVISLGSEVPCPKQ